MNIRKISVFILLIFTIQFVNANQNIIKLNVIELLDKFDLNKIHTKYDVQLAKKQLEKGNSTINGESFIININGNNLFCEYIQLIPYQQHIKELYSLFNNHDEGIIRFTYDHKDLENITIKQASSLIRKFTEVLKFLELENLQNPEDFVNHLSENYFLSHHSKCDKDGNFKFNNIKEGEYYIVSAIEIYKSSDHKYQSYSLINKKIKIQNGQIIEVVLYDNLFRKK